MENAAAALNSSVFILSASTSTVFPQNNPTASPVVPTQIQIASAECANYLQSSNHLPFPNPCKYMRRFSILL